MVHCPGPVSLFVKRVNLVNVIHNMLYLYSRFFIFPVLSGKTFSVINAVRIFSIFLNILFLFYLLEFVIACDAPKQSSRVLKYFNLHYFIILL